MEFTGTAFENIPTRESKFKNDILGHSSFGLYNKSNKRDLNVFLDPAVFVREVDQSSEKSGELINIKLGIRGRSDISKIISLFKEVDLKSKGLNSNNNTHEKLLNQLVVEIMS